ncbi:MAG: hypothetical protein IPG46_19055 [Actinobacteria bacterium]|nr:hypothetical protein [Actinomycetota bacterium]
MPAIDSEFVQATGGTTTSTTFVDAGCSSSALASGVPHLVIGFANHQDVGNLAYDPPQSSELEARFGTTRIGFSGWQTAFGSFAPDVAAGAQMRVAAVVVGDGSSTLNMRVRSTAGDVAAEYASLSWQVIALDSLTEDADYWIGDSASGDTSEVAGTDAGDCGARLRQITDPSGTPTSATIAVSRIDNGSEGEIFLTLTGNNGGDTTPALLAPSFYLHDVRALTSGTTYTFRWEFRDESTWEQGDTDGQVTFTAPSSGDYAVIATAEAFVSGGVVQYRRSRIIVLRLDAFVDYAVITNGGGIQSDGAVTEGSNALTYDFGTGADALVLGCSFAQAGSNWGRVFMRHDGSPDVDYPDADGTSRNAIVAGDTGASDIDALGFGAIVTASGSQSWRMLGSSDSGGVLTVGRNRGDTADARTVLFAIQLETPDSGPSGTMAPTLPLPTTSASGQRRETGTMAPSLPIPTTTSTGLARHVGTIAATLPLPNSSASGLARHQGSLAATLPLPTASASGLAARSGSIAASLLLPAIVASGTASHPPTGTMAPSLPVPTLAASGQRVETGTMATALPIPTTAAIGSIPSSNAGALAATLPRPTISAAGSAQSEITGTASCSLPLPSASISGSVGELSQFDASSLPLTTADTSAGAYTTAGPTADPLSLPLENV